MKFIRVLKSSLPNENSLGEPISNDPQVLQNFWNWFNGSKVVDKQNRPLVVYHGATKKFDIFQKGKFPNLLKMGEGIYFTDNINMSKGYGDKIMHVYLYIKNPLILESPFSPRPKDMSKYDGIIAGEPGNMEYVVFDSNQIKSTTNNSIYNKEDNSIYGGLK